MLCQDVITSGEFFDSPFKVLYLYQFRLVVWYQLMLQSPSFGIWSWKPCLVLVLDHQYVKWWRVCDLKGHGSAFNHSQTIRCSKIPLTFSKKRTYSGWKLLCWQWWCIPIMLGDIYCIFAIIDGLTKHLCRKKCCSLCYDVYQCIVAFEYSLHFMLGGPGIIHQTYF
jgi:hypothetical protein